MGMQFGWLARVNHIVTYTISPFELRAFPNVFSKGVPNMWRRFRSSFFRVAPPLIGAYVIMDWANASYIKYNRKNPADYENEE
ncbi:cytochrome b-c1 complex subunit 8 [Thalassophryne amazonica]|uniref:cytochrome b-c1 complex subunit 8 n=1 Tax=Thalassophryne amazonica TaxID=390379 RepID=UPI0014717F5B|nr:cytochrome b-c1 complex subunit 8 [Thalassophryne amazonica]XP_034037971.1 cytochrome b-c1 complex subunit 8 [Thalassophryne amazonica]XP_034037972.1 cytochrome b-c1 complex subunit 8 [Thalassophryne amazonica]